MENDFARAASYHGKFIELWKDADPELQPRVTEAKKRFADRLEYFFVGVRHRVAVS